ncbi:MAG TPA: preprotein translocase subunit SecA [Haliangiales bacterium]|nr:preprotein translocase subunit SecA [Haliangiales bacterium]
MLALFKKVFGTKNARELKKLQPRVAQINGLEAAFRKKSDAELQGMTAELRRRLDQGASVDDLLHEAFATVRESSRRVLGMRHFDVQLIGGMVLHTGRIAEMRTGEGKTLTATLPCYLNALPGKGVHVVTVNDYLAKRDAEWMGRIYKHLGLSVGVILSNDRDDYEKQRAYRSDITYGQNNEFGFDYLRDNMKLSPDRMVQRELNYAVVDEVDSILIDVARTPLIISSPTEESADLYYRVNQLIPRLKKDVDYNVDEKAHSAMLTDAGVDKVERLLGIHNLYDPKHIDFNHHVAQALRSHTLYKRDVEYVVEDGKVIIIDEHTGRKMPGRRWSDGLHQAIEAKENVTIEEENQTAATITFQNYFRMYKKLSGMTGTAETESEEFFKIYKLEVVVIPTNKPMIRKDSSDLVYKNEKGKFRAVMAEIEDCNARGQPVLVGTISVEKSTVLSELLKKKGIPHNVLNAKFHEMEAQIVAQAGRKGAVTISTNMAGRGTDILLGGNPEFMAKQEAAEGSPEFDEALARHRDECGKEHDEVIAAGGLHILGTERHESRRIDNQLRGRAARQGDPGSSHFYMSLQDDLLRIFGGDKLTLWMERLGMEEDVPIEHPWVNKAIENAQRRVEGQNFDIRKHLLEYDDVMNQQRKTIYALRRQILEGRYAKEPTEDERKKGMLPEVPEKSGDWTVETVSEKVRPGIERMIEDFFKPIDVPEGVEPPDRSWRVLRHGIWRQYGAMCDVEKRFDGERKELVDEVVRTVAASMIQQRERIYDLADGLLGMAIDEACPLNTHSDDWDMTRLGALLQETFNVKLDVPRNVQDVEELAAGLWPQVENLLKRREDDLTTPFFLYFSRHFHLEEIDSSWIEHLKAMEHLREGIGLRGYGQKDPKQEYKKEGFNLFQEMTTNVTRNVGQKLFRVRIERQEEEELPELKQRKMVAVHPAEGQQGGEQQAAAEPAQPQKVATVRRAEPKVGRNDPCPCGSGKKYKKCHGAAAASPEA